MLSSVGFDITSLHIPKEYQEPLDYFLCSLVVWALTDTVMDIAWVRHRWRQTILFSKILGMTAAALVSVWPSQGAVYALCLCLFNGFADPRLHLASIKRNPAHPFVKWFFCITLLAHHTGGSFLVKDMLQPVILAGKPWSAMPLPMLVSCMSEIFAWFTDLKVLMRTAPKWFGWAHQIAVVLQLAACLMLIIWYDPKKLGLGMAPLIGTMVGSAAWLLAGNIGFKNSTHEILPEVDEKASIARVFHKEFPLTQENNLLPF